MKGPSLYLYFQLKMAEKANEYREIPKWKIKNLFRGYKIPNKLDWVIIKEMELLKLLQNKDDTVKIINCQHYDPELDGFTRLTRRRKEIDNMMIDKEGFFDF